MWIHSFAQGVHLSQHYHPQRDFHSFANPEQIRVEHLDLTLGIDFEQQRLQGRVRLMLDYVAQDSRCLWLDCRDLAISAVYDSKARPLDWQLCQFSEVLGQGMQISLKEASPWIEIEYQTSPSAQGLQWLSPAQTLGGELPFLFSQSQPINARSWIPLQDTPKARISFSARVMAPEGMQVVMSALNLGQRGADGAFSFEMDKPIPTHLLAIAVGDIARQEIGPRSAVFAEPGMLAAAAKEFEDIEQMMQVAENLLGPYRWQRYDMLILPPSFPFGGMENPCLAFLTPTLIAGDKSLVATVAHELAHSWTGNLVSNATWRDLWLNEGFTTYFTNRIVEAVYGTEQAQLELMIEYGRLQEEMASTLRSQQTLPANLQRSDPNLAFNRFTYDKASMFVHFLERRIGRERFDRALREYLAHFAFQAITTEDFVAYAEQHLLSAFADCLSKAELMEWIYGSGLPQSFVAPSTSSLLKVDDALASWLNGQPALSLDVAKWRVQHWQYFFSRLPECLSQAQLMELDDSFGFSDSGNCEIACDWFRVAIRNNYDPVLPALGAFLARIGRAKFVRPLYLELQLAGYQQELGDIYRLARPGYHPSLQVQLDRILAWG
ncbi:M1 family metallopeptidase [Shewanella cyperi]|uniref:Aminopeptidase N n=1 Tax=Shewanella cyperi TaxID=2814292 RepID=A0A974XIM2_9GAMM|nr:M1 family metallopeptidase [Shewanella cyperi]